MTLTPQLIKDQEFEVKFRGYDPIEVKDYLEVLADKYFELQEKCKEYEEELVGLHEAKASSEEYSNSLATDMAFTRKISRELKESCAQKEEQLLELTKENEELQLRIADIEQENLERDEEVSAVEAAKEEVEKALKGAQAESESLRNKNDLLKEQIGELKKEEIDFKSALATAQRFAEDLKEKSQIEAQEIVEEAKAEIERIREDAQEELERLPREIQALEDKKSTARAEVKALLENYLETIDVFFPEDEEDEAHLAKEEDIDGDEDDGQELFQKIPLNEDGSIAAGQKWDADELSLEEKALESLLKNGVDERQEEDEATLAEMFRLDDGEAPEV